MPSMPGFLSMWMTLRSQPRGDAIAGNGNKCFKHLFQALSPLLCASHWEGGWSFSLHLPGVSAALLMPTQMGCKDVCGQAGLPTPLAQ